ncbi:MAG: hypothetical protein WBV69_02805 [Candidatus Sulfotelmatobacter sp.]
MADSLKNGFLLDDIVLALARAERGEALSEKERRLLSEAVSILQSAEEGYRWLDRPELTGDTKSSATFFARAVSALPTIHAPEAFLENISEMKATAAQLSKGEPPAEPDRIRLLRTFFYNTSQLELDRTDRLAGEGSADVLRWTVTDE